MRKPRWIQVLFGVGVVSYVAYAAWLVAGPHEYIPARDLFLYCALLVLPPVSFVGRALRAGRSRWAWWAFAIASTTWLVADVGYVLTTTGDSLTPAAWVDWLFLIAYPWLYAGVLLLAAAVMRQAVPAVWLDGLVIALAGASIGTLLVPDLLGEAMGSPLQMVIELSDPLTALLLLSLVLATIALLGRSTGPLWWLFLAGAALMWAADVLWLFGVGDQTYFNGSVIDLGWPTALLLMAAAAWTRPVRGPVNSDAGWLLPLSVTMLAFGIVLFATRQTVPLATVVLAAGAVLAGGARSVLAFRSASARSEAQRQATTDDVTGLANRRGLALALDGVPTDQQALLLVHVDHFRQINDTLGHHAGDEVLNEVGNRFSSVAGSGGTVARLGDNEFAVLLPAGSGLVDATAAAEGLHACVATPLVTVGIELAVEISVGIAFYPKHGATLSDLLRTADRAVVRARRDRAGSLVYDPRWNSDDEGSLLMIQELRRGLDRGEFACHYQPQMDVLTNEVLAVESLLRWQHPERGLMPAGQFLPILEQTALILPVADFVLETSLAQLRLWDQAGLSLRISVNLSATNLMDRALPLRVAQMLSAHHIPADRLTLEITETVLTADQERVRTVLGQLHELGVQLSIDDYGAGFSSLSQIGRLSARELKLDRAFVTGVGQRGDLRSILSATVHLAHGLRLRMVAEGIETASDLDQVRLAGCDLAQGYFISAARPAVDITQWLLDRRDEAQRKAGDKPRIT